ncbi:MAG: hypothetical protein IPJ61_17125 [Tessaracoccus sp.]|uniref:hypothetical protein n=1 Tax=Tessaracoccus sp. TaxID=1971211 RepID=UPI001EC2F372|nr:hypothetical protein [Tessaracoccus sp.]MBK7822733.1 hypothetical protein [Tessaracoccus sp.]
MRVEDALALSAGVVRVRNHPSLRSAWTQHLTSGRLIRALPGVLLDADLAADPVAWMRAVHLWDPDAVIAGAAAAYLTFDPGTIPKNVLVYTRTKLAHRGLVRFQRHRLAPDLTMWRGEVHVTSPAVTALTAAIAGDYATATTALREGIVSQDRLQEAARRLRLSPRDPLVRVLRELSENPWSVAEVDAHRLFRAAGIRGWVGNYEVVAGGHRFSLDIAIPESRIAFEINSFAFHSGREAMMRDSWRGNLLSADGWRQYVLLPTQISNHPEETIAFVRDVVWARHRGGASA